MAAAPPPFALHPADAIQGVIDLTTCEGIKLYQNATRSFYSDPEDFFNCEAPGLHGFLKEVEGRASRFGWLDAILEIPNNIANPLGGTRISSRTMVNFRLSIYMIGKQHISTEYHKRHKTQCTCIYAS